MLSMIMKFRRASLTTLISLIIFVVPVSPNYSLRELDFGGGGGTGQSSNYNFEGMIGENGTPLTGSAYNGGLGFGFTQMANVPEAPSVTNPANYYDRLHVVIIPGGNPSDTLFAIAISSDNFATTQYVKADQAIGNTLTYADYQTYSGWGGGSGFEVLGLAAGTAYQVKVKAMQGDFTESGYGPEASASTVNPTLIFDIDVATTNTPTSPPYLLNLGTLLSGTVTTAANKIWVSIETNGYSGAQVYGASQNGGLLSNSTSYLITATTGDLASLGEGFGVQGTSATQSSGGPLTIAAPYNGGGDSVGEVATTYQTLFSTTNSITGGRGSLAVKAKASNSTPAKDDYQEIFTIIGAANF